MTSNDDIEQKQPIPVRSLPKPLEVPGYGLPIDHELSPGDRFRHGAVDMEFDRMTVRELTMLGLIEALTDKPNWSKKAFDEVIVEKWRNEALSMPLISDKTWDWCLEELRDKAKESESTNMTTVLDMGSRCVKTDNLVPADLRDALKSAVKPLLDHSPRDWHPGSNDQVLNLVHPSLYPAIYGKTRILPHDLVELDDCLAPHDETKILPSGELDDANEGGDDGDDNNNDNNDDDFLAEQEAVFAGLVDEDRLEPFDFDSFNSIGGDNLEFQEEGEPGDPAAGPSFEPFVLTDDEPTDSKGEDLSYPSPEFLTYDIKERDESNRECWSHKFQWLPCDISFTNNTDTSVKITSYINNLHPDKHRPLYHIIESLISLSIPAWNHVLIDGPAGRTPIRILPTGAATDPPERPDWADRLVDTNNPDSFETRLATVHKYWELPDNPDNEPFFEDIDEDWETYLSIGIEWKWKRMRKTVHPEPGVPPSTSYAAWKIGIITEAAGGNQEPEQEPSKPWKFEYKPVNVQDKFRDTGLQVIVKLASIELTPEKPSYAGGGWHIEGMLNEHIVATAIYYFDVDNITESRIRFRQEADLEQDRVLYEQYDHGPLCQLYGLESLRDEPMIQEIGSIATPGDRFLAFPNTLQHKVEPFGLADPTKPGHRRFLVLWLVDPNYRVLSTANVPPQQHEWWIEKAAEKVGGRVSREIQLMIEEQMKDGTMTLEEAKAYRLELMAERTSFTDAVQANVREYDFCEH